MEIQSLKIPSFTIEGKRKSFLDFLHSSTIGVIEILWDCAYSKQPVGLRVERCVRSPDAYYRDPYPLFLTVLAPAALMMPQIRYPMTEKDLSSLISALQ
jgi:hypothetical protein